MNLGLTGLFLQKKKKKNHYKVSLSLEVSQHSSWFMGDKLRVASLPHKTLIFWVFSPSWQHRVIRQNCSSETFMIIGFAPNKLPRLWCQWLVIGFSLPIFFFFCFCKAKGTFLHFLFRIHFFKKPWFSISKRNSFMLPKANICRYTARSLVLALVSRSLLSALCFLNVSAGWAGDENRGSA